MKIQSEGAVMATAMGNVFGSPTEFGHRTEDPLFGETFHLDSGSSRGDDGLNVDVELINEDPVETYFACITTCSLDDGDCITICTEQLRESH
ncbi:hypothetical protein KBZ33_10410 [Cyanobium sp. Cruz-8D1]|uniref:hypothetical protein n=1 Tax=Cyanobium sp. Cruz-8D1 TaxID=2823711 RepID=UPI0020CE3F22|nr:hypothetical protein [Cyanobium sp. Cruz-8D1]MCP9859268.1 hypothetical protein [Cyanobium sp. Cruz-8H5]MCP9866706.1 hypothetical protein [Cyanobium sp. Cruz-8D1]